LPSPRVRPISYLPSSDARVHSAPAGSPFTIHKRTRAGLPTEVVWPTLLIPQPLSLSLCLPRSLELPMELDGTGQLRNGGRMDEAGREVEGAGYL
jgi:hypothetical protein